MPKQLKTVVYAEWEVDSFDPEKGGLDIHISASIDDDQIEGFFPSTPGSVLTFTQHANGVKVRLECPAEELANENYSLSPSDIDGSGAEATSWGLLTTAMTTEEIAVKDYEQRVINILTYERVKAYQANAKTEVIAFDKAIKAVREMGQ